MSRPACTCGASTLCSPLGPVIREPSRRPLALIILLCRGGAPSKLKHLSARAESLVRAGLDAHVIVDEDGPDASAPSTAPSECAARVHFPRAAEVARLGWANMSSSDDGKRWERATLWAHDVLRARDSVVTGGGGYAWFVEDGVFWEEGGDEVVASAGGGSSGRGLQGLVASFAGETADLIACEPGPLAPSWRAADGVLPPAFLAACSAVPITRLSYRILAACAAIGRARGRLAPRDILFPSVVRMLASGVFNVRAQPAAGASSGTAAAPLLVPARGLWLNAPWTAGFRDRSAPWSTAALAAAAAAGSTLFFPYAGGDSMGALPASAPTPFSPQPTTVAPSSCDLAAPRAAVAFFGLVKDFSIVEKSVERHLLAPLRRAGFAVDIFCHTYVLDAISNPRNNEAGARVFPASLAAALPLKALAFSDPAAVDAALPVAHFLRNGDAWPETRGQSALFFVRQLVSLDEVTRLWTSAGVDYDVVVYARPDVLFFNDIDIARHLPLRSGALYTPNFHTWVPSGTGSHGVGLNDRFAFGRADVMRTFGSRLALVESFLARPDRPMLHAEAFLAALAMAQRWSVVDSLTRFGRVRAGGALADNPSDEKLRFYPISPAATTELGAAGDASASVDSALAALASAARAIGSADVPVPIRIAGAIAGRKRARSVDCSGGGGGGGAGGGVDVCQDGVAIRGEHSAAWPETPTDGEAYGAARGYYVCAHAKSPEHLLVLSRCLESIYRVDPSARVVVINDGSTEDVAVAVENFSALHRGAPGLVAAPRCVRNPFPGSGEVYPYAHNVLHREFRSFLTLHDSMVLMRAIPDDAWRSVEGGAGTARALWCFTKWVRSREQVGAAMRALVAHVSAVPAAQSFLRLFEEEALPCESGCDCPDCRGRGGRGRPPPCGLAWSGAFGLACLASGDFVARVWEKYGLAALVPHVTTRTDRCACERIWGIVLALEGAPTDRSALCGRIHSHPSAFRKGHFESLDELIKRVAHYAAPVAKTWYGR